MAERLMETLEEVLGKAASGKLLAEKGGQEVYIPTPQKMPANHWLVEILGPGDAVKMCARFQRERLSLPVNSASDKRRELHRQVLDLTLSGHSANFIAQATGLHARSIRRLRTRYLG